MAKLIALSYDRKTLVSNQDYDHLIQWVWFAKRIDGAWYAARLNSKGSLILMHEAIMKPEPGYGVQHIKLLDTLNNTRENLVVYKIEFIDTTMPRPLQRPYRGVQEVTLVDGSTKYVARIGWNGKKITLGRFTDAKDAARAYDTASYDLYGIEALKSANFRDELLEYIDQVQA
jgi:hypothetical protein